jgi:mRNA interferase MazF
VKAVDVARGEIWLVYLDPTRGKEQAGNRPALVVSDDMLNRSAAGLVIVAPLTTRDTGIDSHIPLDPEGDGVKAPSYVVCEQIRAISRERLKKRWGAVSAEKMARVEESIRLLLGI